MLESPEEMAALQRLLDESFESAGPHMSEIITAERRVGATELCQRLEGMRLLSVATSTADGHPLIGPVDGYFIHGSFYFSAGRQSVKMRHLAARPRVSAMHLPGEEFSVVVHGDAEPFDLLDPARPELRRAMLEHYLPKSGPEFEVWLNESDSLGARIEARKIFTYYMA